MGRLNFTSALTSWLVVCLAISTVSGQQVGTNCSDSRIRRSWDTYNATEKAQYLEAVSLAMDLGFHQKFVQIHVEFMSEKQAHQNCMFIYWHRMLLLGYENMLRSLDPKYRCLTLPYWDHLSAYARQAAGQCNYLLGCTPFLTDSGGAMTGVSARLIIYNVSIAASYSTCVNQGILSHFCGNNSVCAQCVTRGSKNYLASTRYPGEASLGSIVQQVFTYSDSAKFTQAVEGGVHNTIHSVLNGVMAWFQSPADPIFYLHHSLIDLLQVIYLKCQVGGTNVVISAADKGSDPRWFSTCAKRTTGNYTSDDTITMRANATDGTTLVNVWQDPNNILYPFFKDLPSKYVDYVDAKDLGNYSYSYAISGGLANMYQNCNNATKMAAVNGTITTLLASRGKTTNRASEHPTPIIEPGTSYDEKVKRWNVALYEAARIVGYEEKAAREQMEMVLCQYQADCLGGVEDYTDLFRANFHIDGHTRCYNIVAGLKTGDLVIGIPQWKDITNRFVPCVAYKKKTPMSDFAKAATTYATAAGTVSTSA
ncbi:hypothetical protein JG687_00016868 [Phytophthora cactorum]|uniref:Tyrosinase copper-binding domain-containing protein n=1 Tax=Phytophthora cactorum TaxID=29920 RepID=A0A329RFR8_9STRA|nr:hypothetical protein Pcac1_g3033 [Phytophthora cactorum]KAG2805727.1 hypothetical protein PC111_g17688 [Phytophthora cactorum]KAG2841901.1 hypothetical protein PC112_g3173 [Phytophthora cactorum]KAG2864334.1 hypothetical protein PC113_g4673 [Phytophthora cactorum]KAG2882012.1 hypothetical protein PC114_g21255 [Phytophthora cactorum]